MAEEQQEVVELQDDFYQDSLRKLVFIIVSLAAGLGVLIALSIFLYFDKPKPIVFAVGEEKRVLNPVPIDQPYLSTPDVLQWVGDALPRVLNYDFLDYDLQLKLASKYFTDEGWKIFLNQLNIYANYNNVQTYKLFVNGIPAAAPYILKEGLLSGRYAWWIQMPLTIKYDGYKPPPSRTLTLQVLVVRVPTLNNLSGVGIENVIVSNGGVSVVRTT